MNYKEVKKKIVAMHDILTQLKNLGGSIQSQPIDKDRFDKMADKIIITLLETMLMGIVASDLINEFDMNERLNQAFHEAGYQYGIGEEFKRRVDTYTKKINKLK